MGIERRVIIHAEVLTTAPLSLLRQADVLWASRKEPPKLGTYVGAKWQGQMKVVTIQVQAPPKVRRKRRTGPPPGGPTLPPPPLPSPSPEEQPPTSSLPTGA